MSKRAAFTFINTLIKEEKGKELSLNSKITDSGLDPLGYLLVLLAIDKRYKVFKDIPLKGRASHLRKTSMTMKELINKCVLANA